MNFWNDLETKKISKEKVAEYLIKNLGKPTNLTQSNLLQEFIKKINSFYFQSPINNTTIFNLFGYCQEIQARQYKEGKKRGQTYYLLKLAEPKGETLKASQEDLPTDKWTQLTKLAILGKKLVFEYRKWITNKELLDFYPQNKQDKLLVKAQIKSSDKAETG